MTTEPTVCVGCKNLYVVNPKDGYWRWLCMEVKRAAWFNPVTGQTIADPPYSFCKDLNDGKCSMFEPGINSLSPAKLGVGPDGSTFEKMEKTMEGTNG